MADYALPALVSRLKIDTSGFNAGLASAGLALAGLAAGVVAFTVAAVEKTAEAGQAAYQMSEKFGLAKDQSSAWLTVARHLGVNADSLGSGFKFLSKNLENVNLAMETHSVDARKVMEETEKLKLAQDHYNQTLKAFGPHSDKTVTALLALQKQQDAYNKLTGEASLHMGPLSQALKDLGLNIWDAHGKMKSANELMLESADIFAAMPDGIEKSGLAIKLFGKQGMDMLPVLNLGRKGLQDMMIQGQATGEVMSIDQVNAAHKYFLAQQKLNSEITGFSMQLGTVLMPLALRFIDWLTGTAVPGLVAFAKPWMQQLTPAITAFYNKLVTLGPQLKAAYDIIRTWAPFIAGVAAAWAIWNVALEVTRIVQMGILAVQFAAGIVAIVSKVGLWTAAQWLLNLALDANPIGVIVIAVAALVAGVIWAYQNVGWFHDAVNAAWDGLKRFGEWIWSWLKPVLDWLGQRLSDIGGALNAIGIGGSSLPSSSGVTGGGRSGHRAAGGMVVPGGIYTVGEEGPETLVMGSRGGMVIPHGAGGGGSSLSVVVNAQTNADAHDIAVDAAWELRKMRRAF